jgi:4-hydroxybenzoate polyprenyltransferase
MMIPPGIGTNRALYGNYTAFADREMVVETAATRVWNVAGALIRLVRPRHWTKNVFVLVPLLCAGPLTWRDGVRAGWAFGCFCLLASGVYCINDVFDAATDRLHPRKCRRSVATGAITVTGAVAVALLLIGMALLVSLTLPSGFGIICWLYVLNSLIYSAYVKHRVIADVIVIAIGFVLRILAGYAALGLPPSSRVVFGAFSLALLLGFGKRRLEMNDESIDTAYRRSLRVYSREKLNKLIGITSCACLLSYVFYTLSPQAIELHGTENLIYTVPVFAYGIVRYAFKVREGKFDGPVELLSSDWIFPVVGVAWLTTVGLILFLPRLW